LNAKIAMKEFGGVRFNCRIILEFIQRNSLSSGLDETGARQDAVRETVGQ
jgi:hypothetical protein